MYIEMVIAILIFSFIPIVVKYTSANPFTIGFFRLLIAAILVSLFHSKKINWHAYKEKTFWKLAVIGICFFCHWITYTYSIKIAGPSICVLGMATYGVQLIFYGSLFLGYHLKAKNILCLVLILLGVGLVIPSWDLHNDTTVGLILSLVSASFYAVIPIVMQKSHEFNQETRNFYQFSIAFLGYLLFFQQTSWSGFNYTDWAALIFLAVLGTFVAHSLWSKVISVLPTTTTGIVYYLITPTAIVLAALILGEKLSGRQLLGGAVIIVSALLNSAKFDWFKNKDSLKP